MAKNHEATLLNFISEAGLLKRVKRSGWWVLGITAGETVAEHSFRCAVLGYLIACEEKASPNKVLLMTLFNDIHEARINDLHKMAQRYIRLNDAEDSAFLEQTAPLPANIRRELRGLRDEYRSQKTKESVIARDADILECLIQAKEYHEYGFKEALKFTMKAPGKLRTKTARRLWAQAKRMSLNRWWEEFSEFQR